MTLSKNEFKFSRIMKYKRIGSYNFTSLKLTFIDLSGKMRDFLVLSRHMDRIDMYYDQLIIIDATVLK